MLFYNLKKELRNAPVHSHQYRKDISDTEQSFFLQCDIGKKKEDTYSCENIVLRKLFFSGKDQTSCENNTDTSQKIGRVNR